MSELTAKDVVFYTVPIKILSDTLKSPITWKEGTTYGYQL